MREKVCDVEYRIIFLLTYADLMALAVICKYNAVNGKGDRSPLILLYSAVIVGLEVYRVVVFEDRIGLEVESR